MCTNENEKLLIDYENFNKKILTSGGVCLFFSNVFLPSEGNRLPTIKPKLKKILVDFGLIQTCVEINQKLNYIKVWYVDEQARELKGLFLQKFNRSKDNQSIELSINLEGSLVTLPDRMAEVKTYTGLTMLIYQEFIQQIESRSLVDDNPFNEMKEIIKQGNLSPTEPLSAILVEGVD